MRRPSCSVLALCLALAAPAAVAASCATGTVYEDRDGDGRRDPGEPGLAGVKVSDGVSLVASDARGTYRLQPAGERAVFVIKPAGHAVPRGPDGLPAFWRAGDTAAPGAGSPATAATAGSGRCDFPLRRTAASTGPLDVLVFADPQPKSTVDVGYYARDIVEPLLAGRDGGAKADLGLTLGDVVNDDLSLYPAVNAVTARLGVPWLHAPGNHDLDADAASDEASLHGFHAAYGPDTYAWEEPQAGFVVLDDVVARPEGRPGYIGGLREDQFAFLERYLPTLPKDRLLVLAMHIPLFDTSPGTETFRHADRARLFALLRDFPKLLVISGHAHTQQHVFHDSSDGWQGATPLHEYNVGAASGAFWSGVKDAAGIPATTMSDGTPNGHARLRVQPDGGYVLSWHPARLQPSDAVTAAMALHAPRVLRQGAYPAWGVYANVYMGRPDSRVEYRVDGGEWKPMKRVTQPDPALVAENVRDDEAAALRGYDRSPEATPSAHLWRGALPTGLDVGEHRVEVRAFDPWQGEQHAVTRYRLETASP